VDGKSVKSRPLKFSVQRFKQRAAKFHNGPVSTNVSATKKVFAKKLLDSKRNLLAKSNYSALSLRAPLASHSKRCVVTVLSFYCTVATPGSFRSRKRAPRHGEHEAVLQVDRSYSTRYRIFRNGSFWKILRCTVTTKSLNFQILQLEFLFTFRLWNQIFFLGKFSKKLLDFQNWLWKLSNFYQYKSFMKLYKKSVVKFHNREVNKNSRKWIWKFKDFAETVWGIILTHIRKFQKMRLPWKTVT